MVLGSCCIQHNTRHAWIKKRQLTWKLLIYYLDMRCCMMLVPIIKIALLLFARYKLHGLHMHYVRDDLFIIYTPLHYYNDIIHGNFMGQYRPRSKKKPYTYTIASKDSHTQSLSSPHNFSYPSKKKTPIHFVQHPHYLGLRYNIHTSSCIIRYFKYMAPWS